MRDFRDIDDVGEESLAILDSLYGLDDDEAACLDGQPSEATSALTRIAEALEGLLAGRRNTADEPGRICEPEQAAIVAEQSPALDTIANAVERLADHFAPAPQDIVGTDYVARKLGCTLIHAARLARDGGIPRSCIVPGTGTGKLWRLYRRRVDEWLERR